MNNIPKNLYRAEQVQQLDRIAIQEHNIPGMTLMERAGAAAYNVMQKLWPRARRVAVLCGVGNNGGDGYIVARLAAAAGMRVVIYQVGDHSRLKGDALTAFERLEGSHIDIHPFDEGHTLELFDVVIDSMLGTGLSGEVKAEWRLAIDTLNSIVRGRPHVLAIDIPSGLDANNGSILGSAVRADATITFIGMKQGLLTGAGPAYCGELFFNDLKVPYQVYNNVPVSSVRIELDDYASFLQPRERDSHKGDFGHVLIVGGDHGMSGAARLAAEAAARCGAGLLSVATRARHAHVLNQGRPELMCHAVEDVRDLSPLLDKASVVGIGPGLGQSEWSQAMLARVLETDLPLVVDADALSLIAREPCSSSRWILTPHPGEAARLLGCSTPEIQQDRFAAATKIQAQYQGICILKGAGTIVATAGQPPALCTDGNPGMASGGMGDVLTGIIASLIAQQLPLAEAAALGVSLHACAADRSAQFDGERGMLASDLFPHLRALMNEW